MKHSFYHWRKESVCSVNFASSNDHRYYYYWLLLYSTILCSRADSLHSSHMWSWMSDCCIVIANFFDMIWPPPPPPPQLKTNKHTHTKPQQKTKPNHMHAHTHAHTQLQRQQTPLTSSRMLLLSVWYLSAIQVATASALTNSVFQLWELANT